MYKEHLLAMNNLNSVRLWLNRGMNSPDAWAPSSLELDEELFSHIAKLCDGFWMHSGDPTQPHAILTSGLHSNGFLSGPKYLQYPEIAWYFTEQLLRQLPEDFPAVDVVIGSAYAAITFAYEVARQLGARAIHTEKDGDGQKLKHFEVSPDELVLQAEDLMTTTKTTLQVSGALVEALKPESPSYAPAVLTLVSRTPENKVNSRPIIYGVHFNIENFDPASCPLCAAGSEAIRPRATPENWARLTTF